MANPRKTQIKTKKTTMKKKTTKIKVAVKGKPEKRTFKHFFDCYWYNFVTFGGGAGSFGTYR